MVKKSDQTLPPPDQLKIASGGRSTLYALPVFKMIPRSSHRRQIVFVFISVQSISLLMCFKQGEKGEKISQHYDWLLVVDCSAGFVWSSG